jgi:hypothetical protein
VSRTSIAVISTLSDDATAKWLETLKEIVPNLTRVAVLRDAALASGIGQFAVSSSCTRTE